MVKRNPCESCEVSVLDMNDTQVADRAKQLGVGSVPAVVIDGRFADCCGGRGPDEVTLKAAGLGKPLT
jgi:glutaredoxin 3